MRTLTQNTDMLSVLLNLNVQMARLRFIQTEEASVVFVDFSYAANDKSSDKSGSVGHKHIVTKFVCDHVLNT